MRWLVTAGAVLAAIYLSSLVRDKPLLHWVFMILAFVPIVLHKPLKQRFDVDIDGQPVRLQLDSNLLGTVRLKWQAGGESGAKVLGRSLGAPTWFEPSISIAGASRTLLIYVKPFPQGFLISNGNEPYTFTLREEAMCF